MFLILLLACYTAFCVASSQLLSELAKTSITFNTFIYRLFLINIFHKSTKHYFNIFVKGKKIWRRVTSIKKTFYSKENYIFSYFPIHTLLNSTNKKHDSELKTIINLNDYSKGIYVFKFIDNNHNLNSIKLLSK